MSSYVVQYTTADLVAQQLALTPDTNNPGNYFLWDISIPIETLTTFANESNQHVTSQIGDITNTSDIVTISLANQWAAKFGAYRLLTMMAVNWTMSGMRINLGSITVDRLNAMRAGIAEVKAKLLEDIARLTQQVGAQVDIIDHPSQSSPNKYISLGPPPQ